jgi:hypothetical protein
MRRQLKFKRYCILVLLSLLIVSCNFPLLKKQDEIKLTENIPVIISTANIQEEIIPQSVLDLQIPEQATRFPPPPIVIIPKSTVQMNGEEFDAYQIPGDRFRLLCKQPCSFNERMIDALYAGYKVTAQQVVRTAGFDVDNSFTTFDIHLSLDNFCTRFEGELGITGSYQDDPKSIVICLYLTEPDIQADPMTSFTPEGAIRSGGLGVFAHEFAHSLFWGRTTSSHDYVFPIEYKVADPTNVGNYGDLCNSVYENSAPLTYELCKTKGFTFAQMIQSLLDVNRLKDSGFGDAKGYIGYNQYIAVLNYIIGSDTMQAFTDVGYQKLFIEEGYQPFILPYLNEPCTFRAELINDLTIPLGTMLDINTPFEKAWRIKNTGTCNWEGIHLIFKSGKPMSEVVDFKIPDTNAGDTVDFILPMKAPAEPGVHTGEWRLRTAEGLEFGPVFDLTLYTRPGCSEPPQFSFFKANPTVMIPGAISEITWGQVTNVDKVEIIGIGEVDPNGGQIFVRPDQTTSYVLSATCGAKTVTSEAKIEIDKNKQPFEVSNIHLISEPQNYEGSCAVGVPVKFSASVDVNNVGIMIYRWSRSDGNQANPSFLLIENPGLQTIENQWNIATNFEGWMGFEIVAPTSSELIKTSFTIKCVP